MACLVLCCKWYVAKVTDSMCRFNGASTFNGDLSKWYVAKVTDMTRIASTVLPPSLVTSAS